VRVASSFSPLPRLVQGRTRKKLTAFDVQTPLLFFRRGDALDHPTSIGTWEISDSGFYSSGPSEAYSSFLLSLSLYDFSRSHPFFLFP
jgi:hypothetical protein